MNDFEIKNTTQNLIHIIKNASKIFYHKDYIERIDKHKFADDDVTNLDIQTQEYIISEAKNLIPNLSILGEEGQELTNSIYQLIIDPIDGTVNFKNKIPMYGNQICLTENGLPIISILYLPEFDEIFYANKFGAFKNDNRIFVKPTNSLNEVVVSLGDYTNVEFELWKNNLEILSHNIKRIRMFGSSCFDSCMLASGNTSAYIIYANTIWDIMPGHYLMQMAGADYYFNEKNQYYIYGHKSVVDKLKKILI